MYRNQKAKFQPYYFVGILLSVACGVLLHFVYDWSGENRIVAFFAPINESTWEHLKLLVFPLLLYSIFEYMRIGARYDNYMIAKALGILTGMLTITALFYTYTGICGASYSIIDITIYVIGVIAAFTVNYHLLKKKKFRNPIFQPLGVILIMLIMIAFMWFSYYPPKLAFFLDPITHTYGIL